MRFSSFIPLKRKKSRYDIMEKAFYLGIEESLQLMDLYYEYNDDYKQKLNILTQIHTHLQGAQACLAAINTKKVSYNSVQNMEGIIEYAFYLFQHIEERTLKDDRRTLSEKVHKKIEKL